MKGICDDHIQTPTNYKYNNADFPFTEGLYTEYENGYLHYAFDNIRMIKSVTDPDQYKQFTYYTRYCYDYAKPYMKYTLALFVSAAAIYDVVDRIKHPKKKSIHQKRSN